ncbi:hypothetical protein DMN91_005581 [Ooceraea biroi]|uniref:Cytochrome c oxidase subunit n=1 Tax=Ooceraea biroi TaxID=2015173 RepID=A0A026X0P4_OOCBI|nr:cytochrome c oxidase subunit 6A1, mitochondrial [Ooceraea biroi]EZA61880.1 Cytochrome c oxidase subunit 6A1, mitochondrial [Ooceraea biroi]RLU21208.1 hypothetical protein DMN91_005581 [Ooceraea biroi]
MASWMRVAYNCTRRYATASRGHGAQGHGSSEATVLLWKRLSLFVGFPAIGLAMVNCYLNHEAHKHEERAEFIPYEHMRIRTKPFPWGDGNHTLFHNKKVNPLPTGYED